MTTIETTTAAPAAETTMRQMFRYLNVGMLWLWRLGLARWLNAWPAVMGQFVVLTHAGHKSGLLRRTPVNFTIYKGAHYVVAAFGPTAHWYRNIMANPTIELWTEDGWYTVEAYDVSDTPDRLAIVRAVLRDSGFASHAFAGINPGTIDDATLAGHTAHYRVLKLIPVAARTGPGGPGEYSWVWPVVAAALALLLWLFARRKR